MPLGLVAAQGHGFEDADVVVFIDQAQVIDLARDAGQGELLAIADHLFAKLIRPPGILVDAGQVGLGQDLGQR